MGRRAAGEGGLKLRVASIGKDRSGLFQPAVDEYASRLRHYVKLDIVELPAKRTADEEATAIVSKVSSAEWLIALDERGELWSSVELSRFIGKAQQESRDLVFAIGGDEGHGEQVRRTARRVWSLSKLTLPHRLARVVLVEQLYRAFTLLRGEPYHK